MGLVTTVVVCCAANRIPGYLSLRPLQGDHKSKLTVAPSIVRSFPHHCILSVAAALDARTIRKQAATRMLGDAVADDPMM